MDDVLEKYQRKSWRDEYLDLSLSILFLKILVCCGVCTALKVGAKPVSSRDANEALSERLVEVVD